MAPVKSEESISATFRLAFLKLHDPCRKFRQIRTHVKHGTDEANPIEVHAGEVCVFEVQSVEVQRDAHHLSHLQRVDDISCRCFFPHSGCDICGVSSVLFGAWSWAPQFLYLYARARTNALRPSAATLMPMIWGVLKP